MSRTDCTEYTHAPERDRLPKSLQVLDWQSVTRETLWFDSERYLMAVPIRGSGGPGDWCYSIEIVVVTCDSENFSVQTVDGDGWGWDLTDADWFVKI